MPRNIDIDEGGSSYPHVASGRNLRLRVQKRALGDDEIKEEIVNESSDDDVEDDKFCIENHEGANTRQ